MTKGFHNAKFYTEDGQQVSRKGRKRSTIYGSSEFKAFNLLNGFLEKHKVVHEQTLKGKTKQGTKTTRFVFQADFYFPLIKLDLEISPAFHQTYKKVVDGDLKRVKLLKEKLGVKIMVIGDLDLNQPRIEEIKTQIDSFDMSPEVLDYYFA